MIALELLGKLDKCDLFNINKLNIEDIEKVYIPSEGYAEYYEELAKFAHKSGRHDIVKAISNLLARSKKMGHLTYFDEAPLIWRLTNHLFSKAKKISHY